jgi:glutamate-1-semialdehyde 2,1-aminomutase
VTAAQAADTIVLRWNDPEGTTELMSEAGRTVAAVIAEPAPANMGVVPPRKGFLRLLRQLCSKHGALLVLDEVITGFRVAPGGAEQLFGVEADLTILGKVLGGGLPLAAVAGPRRLMNQLAPVGAAYQAGTLSGNPLATAAGLATLAELDQTAYERLASFTERLARGLRAAAEDAGVAVQVPALCGLLTVFFSDSPVERWEDARAANAGAFARFFGAMLDRGIYLPPSPFEAWFPSLAHGEAELERTLDAATAAFAATTA